jgi:transcription elongation GreA/GreB family factor
MKNSIKQELYAYCVNYVGQRVQSYQKAMQEAQEGANSEGKSSAGDKYETGRAMMQIERDKNAKQLEETLKLKKALGAFTPNQKHVTVALGSLVQTNKGYFYISISAGKIELNKEIYFAIAPTSPLGIAMSNLKAGDNCEFNKTHYQILSVR